MGGTNSYKRQAILVEVVPVVFVSRVPTVHVRAVIKG